MGSMNALKNTDTEAYGFQMRDVAVAAMIKSNIMKQEDALETLGRIVSPGVKTLTFTGLEKKKIEVENSATKRIGRRYPCIYQRGENVHIKTGKGEGRCNPAGEYTGEL